MSRAHLVDWICDRCGNKARVRAKSDTHLPDGWSKLKPPEGIELDLCGPCSALWDSSHKAFFEEFVRNEHH